MPVYPYRQQLPRLGKRVWIAPSADVIGPVEVGDDASFLFGSVTRCDVHWIRIGARSNVQDNAVLHVSHGTHPLQIGEGVTIGHSAVVHGCTIGDGALIGIGAHVLDGAVIEPGAQVAAGALVPPDAVIPSGHLAMGVPAKRLRPLSDEEKAALPEFANRYVRVKGEYLEDGVGLDGAAEVERLLRSGAVEEAS